MVRFTIAIFAWFTLLNLSSCTKDDTPDPATEITITSFLIDGVEYIDATDPRNISIDATVEIVFSSSVDPAAINGSTVQISDPDPTATETLTLADNDTKIIITPTKPLTHLSLHQVYVSSSITGKNGLHVTAFSRTFYTELDPTPKLPLLANDEDSDDDNTNDLLSVVQKQTFKYFWDFAHSTSGLARERNTSGDIVTIGGSGFGVMALIVGVERGFITREECLTRLGTILTFLETCDRFHGAWPHWLNGNTGKIVPFSPTDDGGDIVETSFMVQGLLTMRQYLDSNVTAEGDLITRINDLVDAIEYDWYTNSDNVLYWLWSPNNGYILKVQGYNETLITYLVAASSNSHAISAEAYTSGYARGGSILNGNTYYGFELPLGGNYGGPLFFTHYSFLGLNPTNLSDAYANYWTQNVNQSLINHAYCVANPKNFVGYSDECWGLTASDNQNGYSAHSPSNDLGVITPTAALSSFPYTPTESMKALKFFYYQLGDRLWGPYGFYDAFNVTAGWTASSYLAIDQGPIIVMIENYRTGLLWDLFMSCPEVQSGLTKLGFTY